MSYYLSARARAAGLALGLTAGLAAPLAAYAGKEIKEVAPPEPKKEDTSCFIDPLWDLAAFIDDKEAPFIQYLGIHGLYHGQYYWVDADGEGKDDDWDNRRQRIGIEGTFLKDFDFFARVNLNFDEGDFFDTWDELWLKWKPADEFNLTVGKLKPAITQEWRLSSRFSPYFERSVPISNVIPDKLWGGQINGKVGGGWLYELGLFSGSADTEDFNQPTSDGGLVVHANLGYDFKDGGIVRAGYLYNDGDEGNNFVKPFRNVYSLSYEGTFLDDRFNINADLVYGSDQSNDRGDVWGLAVTPSFLVTENIQVVARYAYAGSDTDNGIALASRYERAVPDLVSTRVGDYHSVYGGVNYLVCGNRLKLMAGVEYARGDRGDGDDFEAVTALTGVRLFFGKGKKTAY
jgi:phosphate-selective porin OprO/OprP